LGDVSHTAPMPTPLFDLHVELGARMVQFTGYALPIQYPNGILDEHRNTREAAGLFDVSHMGQIRVAGPAAAEALETVLPATVIDIPPGRVRYSFLTDERAGILDDLMVVRDGDAFVLVVNSACKDSDLAYLVERIGKRCDVRMLEARALIALQGPAAATAISRLAPELDRMPFMSAASVTLGDVECLATRTGYTGEDGFEISVPEHAAISLARRLLGLPGVSPAGLGARDSLRLEAGLCLYGHDIDATTTPVEAGLAWAIPARRRVAGGYPGAEVVTRQLADGPGRRRVGVLPGGRAIAREGTPILTPEGTRIGTVTSGGFGPTVGGPIAMGYVAAPYATEGQAVRLDIRGGDHPATVATLPFVPHRYAGRPSARPGKA
jgi:aminomethyltransferase